MAEEKIKSFRDLRVWQLGIEIVSLTLALSLRGEREVRGKD